MLGVAEPAPDHQSYTASSRRTLSTVAVTVPITLVTGLHFGYGWEASLAVILTTGLLALSLIDLDHMLLPDVLVLPLLWLGLLANSLGLFAGLHDAVWGVVLGFVPLWAVGAIYTRLTGRCGIGLGDVKLLAMIGAWGGWQVLVPTILLASCAGILVAAALRLLGKAQRNDPLPFGPYLAGAGWITLITPIRTLAL